MHFVNCHRKCRVMFASQAFGSLLRWSSLGLLSGAIASASFAQASAPPDFPVSVPTSSPIDPARQSFRDEDWATQRTAQIGNLLKEPSTLRATKLLFVGDSITQFWATNFPNVWRETFGDTRSTCPALNLGFSGDRTENLLLHLLPRHKGGDGYLDDASLDPDVIVLMIGVNNTWKNDTGPVVENVVAGNIAIIARLRQLRPRATIIVQSLLPAYNREHTVRYIVPINRLLRRLTLGLGPRVRWLDLYPLFVGPDASPSEKLFDDGVHPNADGYRIWYPELLKAVRTIRPCASGR